MDQCNRIKNPELNPDTSGQVTFDQGGKDIKWEKKSLQQVVMGKLDIYMLKNGISTFSHMY